MPTIDELIALTKEAEAKNDALVKLAEQQVVNQPFLKKGQAAHTGLTGRGTPEQQRAMVAMLSRGLNRSPGETSIGALGAGFEEGMALKDKLAMAGKGEKMLGAEAATTAAQSALENQKSLYGLQAEERKLKEAAQKQGTVQFGGQVWQTDHLGRPVRPLGKTEGEMGRDDDAAVRQQKAAQEAQAALEAQLAQIDSAADYGAAIQTDINQIRAGLSGWTTGTAGWAGQHVPGTDAYDQRLLVEGLKAKLGIDKLREMRAAAKSGASGMGNLTEKELDRLESAIAKIDMGGTKGAMETALKEIEKHYQPILDAYARVYGEDKLTGSKVLNYDPATGEFK